MGKSSNLGKLDDDWSGTLASQPAARWLVIPSQDLTCSLKWQDKFAQHKMHTNVL